MTLRDVAVFSPITVGWLTAAYFQIRAFRNLREPRPNERLFTLFFGEWGIRLHTVEGNRNRPPRLHRAGIERSSRASVLGRLTSA